MPSSSLKLAVFDCDGTLVDSQHSIIAAMHSACEALGVRKPDASAIRRMVGLPLLDVVAGLMPEMDAAGHQQLRDVYADAFHGMRQDGRLREPLFPGVEQVMAALEGTGWLLGIATGKSRRGLLSTLERHGLGQRFVTLQTSDFAQGKPHPEMLLNAMAEGGTDRDNTIMIGDTTYDVEMACNAGVRAVGVGWGYHDRDDLLSAGAHAVVDAYEDLPGMLEDMRDAGGEE